MRRWCTIALVLVVGTVVPGACGGDDDGTHTASRAGVVIDPGDGGRYAPRLDPADFVDRVDNPYFPLAPGSRWVYGGTTDEGAERIVVEVLAECKDVMGIEAVVVRDTVTIDGELVEDTNDWYAQDLEGNVWYLGETTAEYENGRVVSTAGSWEAGQDGAHAGIVMEAEPRVGDAYRQEFYPGEAEDLAEVVRTGDRVRVPSGAFDEVVVTQEWNPLAPGVVEHKHYAPGVGQVSEEVVRGGRERIVLVEHRPASALSAPSTASASCMG
jgi:hypothetical protein